MSKFVDGADELSKALQNLSNLDMQKVTDAGGFVLEGKIKLSMTEAKHGRTYVRGGKSHRASAPGEAPAVDFGTLINSIQTVPEGGAEAATLVGTHLEKAQDLEKGRARMKPRPFMRPGVDNNRDEIEKAMADTAKRLAKDAVS